LINRFKKPRPSGDNFDDNLFIENLEDNPGEEIERHATVEVKDILNNGA